MSLKRFERTANELRVVEPLPGAAPGARNYIKVAGRVGIFALKRVIRAVLAFALVYIAVYVFHEMQAQGLLSR